MVSLFLALMLILSLVTGGDGRGRAPPLASLKAAMFLTAALIFGASLLVLQGVFSFFNVGVGSLIWMLSLFIAFFIVFQWLFSPAFINTFYGVKVIDRPRSSDERWLKETVERLARKAGFKKPPKIGIAWGLGIPNAFAYSSPIYGSYIAVTPSLLSNMPREEVEAVLAHEVGHLKHRDVMMMLAVSFIPILIYELGRYLMYMSFFGFGYGYGRDREERGGALYILAIALLLIIVGIIFHFLVRHFNRLREYYADAHSAMSIGDPTPLQRALARLDLMYKGIKRHMAETDTAY
jgi:heat shock protein HtpX